GSSHCPRACTTPSASPSAASCSPRRWGSTSSTSSSATSGRSGRSTARRSPPSSATGCCPFYEHPTNFFAPPLRSSANNSAGTPFLHGTVMTGIDEAPQRSPVERQVGIGLITLMVLSALIVVYGVVYLVSSWN